MADHRNRPLDVRQRQSDGPQRIADVLNEVLARYGYDVRPQAGLQRSSRGEAAGGTPVRQLELFGEAGLAAPA